jgi:hypothetical protein
MPFDAAVPQPPTPAYRPPSEPVGVGTLVSRTFSVWSKHMWLFAGFTLVLFIPAVLVMVIAAVGGAVAAAGMSEGGMEAGAALGMLGPMLGIGLPLILIAAIANMGGLTYGAIQGLAGRPVSFGTMFSVGFRRLFPMIGAGIVVGLAVGLGFVLLIVPGVILGCGLSIVMPIVVAEKRGPIDAIGRSWNLTSGYKGTIFLTGLVFGLIYFGLALVGMVFNLIPILGQLASLLINVLTGSLGTIWYAVAYHDIRVAKEGVATDDLAKVFE